jgi:hypothetical protein
MSKILDDFSFGFKEILKRFRWVRGDTCCVVYDDARGAPKVAAWFSGTAAYQDVPPFINRCHPALPGFVCGIFWEFVHDEVEARSGLPYRSIFAFEFREGYWRQLTSDTVRVIYVTGIYKGDERNIPTNCVFSEPWIEVPEIVDRIPECGNLFSHA